jgi:hypothetical protein
MAAANLPKLPGYDFPDPTVSASQPLPGAL